MIKVIKEVLKRENRYKYYEDGLLIKEKYYYKNIRTEAERKDPYFINIISYDKDGNSYERMSFYAKNKGRKLRRVFKKNGYYYRKNGPALIIYGAPTENFKLYCKYFNENGCIGRDYGPCSFKIMNDNSYSEEKYILNGFSFEKEEYNKLINNIKNDFIDFENLPIQYDRLLESLKNISKLYKKQNLIKQIESIKVANALTKNNNNDCYDIIW